MTASDLMVSPPCCTSTAIQYPHSKLRESIGPAGTNPTALARATPVAFTNTSDQTQTLTAGALSWCRFTCHDLGVRPGSGGLGHGLVLWTGHIYLMLANDLIHRVVPSAVTVGEDRPNLCERWFSGVFHHDQHTVTKINGTPIVFPGKDPGI